MARVGAPNACSTSAKPLRKRGINVDSSFTGMKTDKSVGSLTKMRSRCRRTNSRLMYQSPSLFVDTGASAMVSIPNRRSTRCVHLKVSTFHLSRAELGDASSQFLLPLLDRSNLTSCCDLRWSRAPPHSPIHCIHHLQKLLLGEYSLLHKQSGKGFLLNYLGHEEFFTREKTVEIKPLSTTYAILHPPTVDVLLPRKNVCIEVKTTWR